MIPLPHTVKQIKEASLDDWGQPTTGRTVTHKCRIDSKSELVQTPSGKEAVASATILLKGLVSVNYGDLLEWKEETGNRYAKHPLNVALIRDFGGKPMFTKVVV